MFSIKRETILCKTCSKPTPMLGTKLCDPCWEVETRLPSYLNNKNAIRFVSKALNKAQDKDTPTDSQPSEPDKVKPLAQYLDEYIEHEVEGGNISPDVDELFAYNSWRELLEQAFDAYESTEQVKIRIERV